jgi:mRNA interferase HicA
LRGQAKRALVDINNIVYNRDVTSKEFRRWLAQRGAVFKAGKGSHLKVYLNGRQWVLPMDNAELKKGLVEGIKKQLGLK